MNECGIQNNLSRLTSQLHVQKSNRKQSNPEDLFYYKQWNSQCDGPKFKYSECARIAQKHQYVWKGPIKVIPSKYRSSLRDK